MSYIQIDLSDQHYLLLSSLYGRDLGGIPYFKWKHYSDPQVIFLKNKKKAIIYQERNRDLGIFVAK
ncbi:hypothetical protein GMA8713_03554 [Grimontia marina]|uniref:Uncharacterized protein n=1 Tax=Grimontia marina TaxID=646534 RepID=A0A128FFB7_9GAMM|nr:hypothetical protein GMA8713_03554 [Grimontia marina]